MKIFLKRNLTVVLALMMVFTSVMPVFSAPARGKTKNDISGHWAEGDLLTMKDNGVMGGYPDGSMKPDRYVTIAETVKIINKAFQIEGAGDVYAIPYTDVKPHEWYSNDIALAVENGYLQPVATGMQLRPNAPATREQIGAMFSQIMGLPLDSVDSVAGYKDYSKITGGYQYYFAAAVSEGLFVGYPDNTVRPKATVTRAIMAAVSNRAMTSSSNSELHPIFVGPGDLLIENAGEVISNRIVDNLWIAPSVGEGEVTLENVTVRGKLVIKGGGPKSVTIIGESDVALVYMEKESGDLRLRVESPAIVGNVNINAGSRNYITGQVDSVIQNVKGSELNVEQASINIIQVKGESSDLNIDKKSTVNSITVNRKASDAFMSLDGKISSVVVYAPFVKTRAYGTINSVLFTSSAKACEYIAEKGSKTSNVKSDADRVAIRGPGIVENAVITGNDNIVDTVPTRLEVDKDAEGTTSNGNKIPGGSTGNTTPGGGLDNGGLPINPNLKVTGMEITKYPSAEKLVYTVGDSLDLTGLEVSIQYDNGSTKKFGLSEFNANSISINPNPDGNTKVLASTKTVKITHVPSKKTATVTLTVNPIPKVKEIMITESPKKDYINGDNLDLKGMKVLLRFDNEATKTVAFEKTKNSAGNDSDTFRDMGIETGIPNGTQLNLKSPGDKEETKDVSVSFRNPNNTVVKAADPLVVKITPVPRISGVSANGYKFSYVYGDKFDFSNMEVRLVNSNPDKPQIVLRYIPVLGDFVIKNNEYTSDSQYKEEDLYKQTAPNGDILREVKITQSIAKKDISVQHGDDVGLGDQDNNKVLKITHHAKDVAPASTEVNMAIKPPSKAVSATVTNMGVQFDEGDSSNLEDWLITVYRDSVVNQNPNDAQASDSVKVLYGKKDADTTPKLYEYTFSGDKNTWKEYNYKKGDAYRNMQIIVMQKTSSGSTVSGPDLVTSPEYKWQPKDVGIKIIHAESGVRVDSNGNPIPSSYDNIELAYIPIVVKPEKGLEIFQISKDPTFDYNLGKANIFYVGKTLDINSLEMLIKPYNGITQNYSYTQLLELKNGNDDILKTVTVTLLRSDGIEETNPNNITLQKIHDGAKIKISVIENNQTRILYTNPLRVRTMISKVDIYSITPKIGETPKTTIAPTPDWYPQFGSEFISWMGDLDSSGKFKADTPYYALIKLRAKPGYTFFGINVSDVKVVDTNGTSKGPVDGSFELSEDAETITFRILFSAMSPEVASGIQTVAPSIMSLTPTPVAGSTAQVRTADEFYSALDNSKVGTIEVVANITLTRSVTTTKNIIVKDGYTLTYYVDATVNQRNTGISNERNKEARQFRITKNATLTVENQATLNKLGTGDITVDNGGKVVAYGTLSTAGKKLIGKQGTTLKTYGNSSIVISATSEGQIMTLSGNADLIQSLTLDKNLVVANGARLNVKQGKTLRANSGISITNRGTMYLEDSASIAGSGEFTGTAPVGNSFGGFLGADSDAVRYGSKSTALDYRKYNSNINMSFTVPYKTRTVYFSGVNVKAGDLKPGTYTLRGTDGISSVPIVIGAPSVKTGLSRVGLGTNGYVLPATLRSGNYTVNGIIGGLNVTLEINIA